MIKPKKSALRKNRANTFRANEYGGTAIEFAIVAPVLFAMIFGIFEFSRYLWVEQATADVAYNTARCASVGTSDGATICNDESSITTYAIDEASGVGVRLEEANISTMLAVQCNGYNGNEITINFPFVSPIANLVPAIPSSVTAHACYPA